MVSQRETIDAASSFGKRNQLPKHLLDQMIAHLSLKYRIDSEGVHQQETIDSLPKAIRSSISHFLFYSLVDRVYLFQGVSNDLLFQLVTTHILILYSYLCFALCFLIFIEFQKLGALMIFTFFQSLYHFLEMDV